MVGKTSGGGSDAQLVGTGGFPRMVKVMGIFVNTSGFNDKGRG